MLSKTVYSLLNSDCEILKRFGILLKRKLSPVDDHELNDLLKLARNNYDPDIFGEINSRLESVITRTLTVERNFFGDPENSILSGRGLTIRALLRAVRTQAILFMKSMSERVGSDIERLGVKMKPSSIDCESTRNSISGFFYVGSSMSDLSDINFKNQRAWVRTTLNRALMVITYK